MPAREATRAATWGLLEVGVAAVKGVGFAMLGHTTSQQFSGCSRLAKNHTVVPQEKLLLQNSAGLSMTVDLADQLTGSGTLGSHRDSLNLSSTGNAFCTV